MKKALGWASRFAVALAVFAGALLGTASAASAAPLDTSSTAGISAASTIVKMADDDEADVVPFDESVIMFRWINGTQHFDYVTDGNPVSAMTRGTQRTMFYQLPMSIGNGMWSGTSALLDGATQFKPMKLVGYEIDQAAANIGQAIIDSPLIAAAIVVATFGTIFALKRGGDSRPWRTLFTTLGVVAMFVVMVVGARGSTSANGYTPGVGSPGWFLTTISDATAQITSSVSGALAVPTFDPDAAMSCNGYVADIVTAGNEARAEDGETLTSTAPMSSALWVQTGLRAYELAQFGENHLSKSVYCHVLDWAHPTLAAAQAVKSGAYVNANPNSAAFSPNSDEQSNRSAIAWAVCMPDATDGWWARPEFFAFHNGEAKWGRPDTGWGASWGDSRDSYGGAAGHCNKWWSDDAKDWDSSKFYVGPNSWDINKFMENEGDGAPSLSKYQKDTRAGAKNFLMNWQGVDSTGILITNTYVISSLIISIAFLIVSGAIFFVNIALVVTLLSIFVVMLVVMFTRNDVGQRLGGFVKNLIGLIVFSSVAALLIAMLAKIVEVLGALGAKLFEGSAVAVMLWSGLSPIFALIMLNFVFTKLIKVPSPFKLSSAMAWGAAAGAAGGAAGAGLIARGERAGENMAKGGLKKAGGAIADKAKGIVGKDDKREGSAAAVDSKTDRRKSVGENVAGENTEALSAKEQRAERKQALAEAKAARKEGDKAAKNDKFLSAADSLLGGKGDIAARSGWRGAVNSVTSRVGMGDILSEGRTELDAPDTRNFQERLSEAGMARSAAALGAAKESLSNGRAEYMEKWRNDPRAAIGQTVRATAKYGALAVGTVATGGAVGAVYAGVKANTAVRNAGYAGVGVPGGSRQYQQKQVDAFRQRKQEQAAAQAKAKADAARQQAQQQQQSIPAPQTTPDASRKPSGSGGGGNY